MTGSAAALLEQSGIERKITGGTRDPDNDI
jgi:hypothetical protein